MKINSTPVVTTNLDAGSDNAAAARADLLDLATKHNQNASVLANNIEARAAFGIDTGQLFSSVGGGALTIALRTQQFALPISADDPIKIKFPVSSGSFNVRSVTAPLSITVPSGATLGHVSSRTCAVHVYAVDVSGTVHLAVSARYLGDAGFGQSFTQISAGATSATTAYTSAATGSYSFKHLGAFTFNNATAGTWSAAYSQAYRAEAYPLLAFSRTKSATQNADNTGATIVFQTAEIDTYGVYDAAAHGYYPQETGYYDVAAAIQVTGSGAGNNNVTVQIRVNGVTVREVTREVRTSVVENIAISAQLLINCGLAVSIRVVTSTANFVVVQAAGTSWRIAMLGR